MRQTPHCQHPNGITYGAPDEHFSKPGLCVRLCLVRSFVHTKIDSIGIVVCTQHFVHGMDHVKSRAQQLHTMIAMTHSLPDVVDLCQWKANDRFTRDVSPQTNEHNSVISLQASLYL